MIDLHIHILAGLDDGPESLAESLEMARMGFEDGIRTMVATPHTLNGIHRNSRSKIMSGVCELNRALEGPDSELRIVPGSDVHLCEETLRGLDEGEVMTVGDARKYLLLELPYGSIPLQAEEILLQFLKRGVVPIISHPERNLEFRRKPRRYYEMIQMGCVGQVTAMSLTGGFGPDVRQAAEKMLRYRLVHVIASDSHSSNGRPPILSKGVKAAAEIVGEGEARKMVTDHPQSILEGLPLHFC